MDIEQLRMILDTVNAATGDAKQIAIVYFVFDLFKYFLLFGVFVVVGYTIYRTTTRIHELKLFKVSRKARLGAMAKECWYADDLPHDLYKAVEKWSEQK